MLEPIYDKPAPIPAAFTRPLFVEPLTGPNNPDRATGFFRSNPVSGPLPPLPQPFSHRSILSDPSLQTYSHCFLPTSNYFSRGMQILFTELKIPFLPKATGFLVSNFQIFTAPTNLPVAFISLPPTLYAPRFIYIHEWLRVEMPDYCMNAAQLLNPPLFCSTFLPLSVLCILTCPRTQISTVRLFPLMTGIWISHVQGFDQSCLFLCCPFHNLLSPFYFWVRRSVDQDPLPRVLLKHQCAHLRIG